jgi:hypothetical protein
MLLDISMRHESRGEHLESTGSRTARRCARGIAWASTRRPPSLTALALVSLVGSCADSREASDENAACLEITAQVRSCELLSEGTVDCSSELAASGYFDCLLPCARAASCEDFRVQACDDLDNDLALCIDACSVQAYSVDCGGGVRVPGDRRCDGTSDCTNGDDERGCSDAQPACGAGQAVPESLRCDGVSDCDDGRDEADCPMRAMTLCPGGEF